MSVFEEFESASRPLYRPDAAISFGCNPVALAKALRTMADEIEKHNILPQSVRQTSLARLDDYPFHSLRIVFADTKLGDKESATKVVSLYADARQLPVDVAVAGGNR